MSVRPLENSRYLPAIAAGLLLAISFPKVGIAGFAWVAPGLMLLAALGTRGGESFRIGYVAGLAQYLASLYWLLFIPYSWHSIPVGPIAGWVALCAYLALYPAIWVWLACQISNSHLAQTRWLASVEEISSWSWSRRMLWAFSCAAIWVALEVVLTRLGGGFPWNLLGVSQHRIVPLIQVASITGVYGVSLLVAWSSVSLLCAGIVIMCRPHMSTAWMREVMLPFAAVIALFVFGFHRIVQAPAGQRELKATLVQPSIPQTLIWNPEKDAERFHDLIRLTEVALTSRSDLLIWPESAIPRMLRYDRETFQAVTNLAVKHQIWMIVGSDDAEPSKHSTNPKDVEYYNCSFLVSPAGELVDRYRKRSLVIFGEYIPLERWLPFLKWFTPIQGGFAPGDRAVQFELTRWGEQPVPANCSAETDPREPDLEPKDGSPGLRRAAAALASAKPPAQPGSSAQAGVSPHQQVKTSVLICFEDIFPQLARESAREDADFLVNLTNDGWFGESAAQWQHAANAGFRAVENGMPLIRCTNTGLTCWFDSCGRRREFFTDRNGSVYGTGFMAVNIPLLQPGQKRVPTFYNQYGDWLGWGCVAVAGLALIGSMIKIRRTEPAGQGD